MIRKIVSAVILCRSASSSWRSRSPTATSSPSRSIRSTRPIRPWVVRAPLFVLVFLLVIAGVDHRRRRGLAPADKNGAAPAPARGRSAAPRRQDADPAAPQLATRDAGAAAASAVAAPAAA